MQSTKNKKHIFSLKQQIKEQQVYINALELTALGSIQKEIETIKNSLGSLSEKINNLTERVIALENK